MQYAGDYDLVGNLHKLVKGQGAQALTPQKLGSKGGPPRYKHSAGTIRPDKRGRPFGKHLGEGGRGAYEQGRGWEKEGEEERVGRYA